jgi:hypothetical protein
MESDILSNLKVSYANVIAEHREWLQQFDKERLKKWEDLLKANSEAAICEALTRKLLSDHNIDVQPYEDLSKGGPDFLCSKNCKRFYVETTCVTIEAATKETGLSDKPLRPVKAQYFGLMTGKFLGEICNKIHQCSNLRYPCIIAIGTLHFQAGCVCFNKRAIENILTGTTQITMKVDPKQGYGVGDIHESTSLRDSAFIRFDKTSIGQIECARDPISAILLCPFGSLPTKVIGVLHPNPNHEFDRSLLPKIEFGRLAKGWQSDGRFKVEWI